MTQQQPPSAWSPSTSSPRRARLLPHEREDLDKMAKIIFFENLSFDNPGWLERSLRQALIFMEQLGTTLPARFLRITRERNVSTLAGRAATYPQDWTGRSPMDMSLCGLFHKNDDAGTVVCFMCGVDFRGMDDPNVDHWMRHKELAPNCLQLKRYNCQSTRPTPVGKATRRNSACVIYDMLKPPAGSC